MRSKWGNKKEVYKDITFDSAAEAQRYRELEVLLAAGRIKGLRHHVRYEVFPGFRDARGRAVRPIHYEPDFVYYEADQLVAEDVKGSRGTMTPEFRIKSKLFRKHTGMELRIVLVQRKGKTWLPSTTL